ncbi:adenine phosphoribosyltransferase [Pseudidiomarina aestuarii]|uniref:adenine phosphoribosyltransferase n=1 Tax=Pseudidiomarina aestuarii TaxID=624146 RepID=UPI003A98463B
MSIEHLIRVVPDYPKPGILFRDITPLLADADGFREVIDRLAERYHDQQLTHVVGIEARGFIFATALAYKLGVGFVPLRKPGKLPSATYRHTYQLEYGEDTLEIHQDALSANDRVVIIDDLLATGGTVLAAVDLIAQTQATLVECAFLVQLDDLPGAQRLADASIPSYTLCRF